jgi:hypothetical protein
MTWLTIALLGATVVQFLLVQTYIVAAMRYQADFMPTLMLLAALGLWQGLAERIRLGKSVAAYSWMAMALMTWTSVAGMLLGITSQFARFENLNPALFDRLVRFFTL